TTSQRVTGPAAERAGKSLAMNNDKLRLRGAAVMTNGLGHAQAMDAGPKGFPLSTTSPYLPALLLLFVGSGCAALIYQVVWFQMLSLIIGSSAISLGLLLAIFMGGMC